MAIITATAHTRGTRIDIEVTQRLLKSADFAVLGLGAILLGFILSTRPAQNDAAVLVGFVALELTLLCLLSMRSLSLYDIERMSNWLACASQSALICILIGVGNYLMLRYFVPDLPFAWLRIWVALCLAHFGLTRLLFAVWAKPLMHAGRFRKRIAIVGGGKAAEEAIKALEHSAALDCEIIGLFDDRYDERSPKSIRTHHKIGKIAELAQFAREHRVDLIIVAIPFGAESRLLHILKRLWELPVDIRISGQASSLKLSPRAYTYLGELPLLAVFDRPLTAWGAFLKSAMDRVLAAILILLLSPVMLAAALAVRLESKGPILFKQRRYGFNNELIEIYKFRSMYADKTDASAAKLVTRNDPRVTRVGRIIRKTSIDELPQLFNVLTGQLSLVGPRPHATQAKAAEALYEQVVDGYFARHKVKPGITGWAQIKGWRGETDTKEKIEQRVKHDLDYIDRWSLGLDLYIILKTPFALLKAANAY
jgi:Undecaprenyl-phosphate glucose phosphotransferase